MRIEIQKILLKFFTFFLLIATICKSSVCSMLQEDLLKPIFLEALAIKAKSLMHAARDVLKDCKDLKSILGLKKVKDLLSS